MTNTIRMSNEQAVNRSIELMNTMVKDEAIMKAETFEEKYEAFRKYADISKENFKAMLNETESMVSEDYGELSESELDMVVGGSFFSKIGNSIKSAATSLWNSTPGWVKGALIGAAAMAVVGLVLCTGAAGLAVLSAEAGTALATFTSSMAAGSAGIAIASGAGAIVGGILGFCSEN